MDLIVDTSYEQLKVILSDNGISFCNQEKNGKHLQNLLPEIDRIMTQANKSINQIDNFCVVLGPGSFTGVRIGVSTVKAFLMALPNKKVIGINKFELITHSIFTKLQIKSKVAIVIKSTATKYYFALVSSTGIIEKMNLLNAENIIKEIKNENAMLFSLNDEFNYHDIKSATIVLTNEDYINFVKLKKNNNAYMPLQELKPIYLALSQAEEELLKRQAKND